jgi:methyltransferase (TIGR00027 family)
MKRGQSSITAQGIAFARAKESQKPEGERICYDPYARQFVSRWLWATMNIFSGYAAWRSPGVFELLATRTRYIDDFLSECIGNGLQQLVILGAGFDSRPYRFERLKGKVRVFEIDHPATQAVKVDKVKQIFGALPEHVTYVAIDFDRQSLEERMAACGYDAHLKTLFIWEGVIYYLTRPAIDSTLEFIARHSLPGSSLIFDYIYTSAFSGGGKRTEVKSMQRYRGLTGEGLQFSIDEGAIQPFLEQRGFCDIKNADNRDWRKLYFTGVNASRPLAGGYAIATARV